jgi:pyruvate,water dikinase
MDILWLGEEACHDVAFTGGKAANLSLLSSTHPVPPGFCVTTAAYGKWESNGKSASCPPDFQQQLKTAWDRLESECEGACRVAVRSSAVDEDGQQASFAGQYETFLNVEGLEALADAVMRCWASAETERAIHYRETRAGLKGEAGLAVLVQRLVPADASVVAFSANPVTGSRDEVVINSAWGLGESVVGGTVTPDTFVVGKKDLSVTKEEIADKTRMTVSVAGGTEEVSVPGFMRKTPSLDSDRITEIARLALDLEKQFGYPVDLECAVAEGQLYLLQCRPVTTV